MCPGIMNSDKGWLRILQQVDWKMFFVPRPQVVVNQSSRTLTRFEDHQGNRNPGPVSSILTTNPTPDVRNCGSNTAQLVVSLNQRILIDNPSDETYKPSSYKQERPEYGSTEYANIGSTGIGSSTTRLVLNLTQNVDVTNASNETYFAPYDNVQTGVTDANSCCEMRRKRILVIGLLLVLLCVLAPATIALGLHFFNKESAVTEVVVPKVNTSQEIYESTVDLNVKLNETYQAAMANDTSYEFLAYQERYCNYLNQTLPQELTSMKNCTINKLSNGSIIVNSTLLMQSKKNLTQNDLLDVLLNGYKSNNQSTYLDKNTTSPLMRWGDLFVHKLEITRFVTNRIAEEDNFNCWSKSLLFLPLKDTYPSKCNMFQLCINNRGENLQCPDGMEFAYTSSKNSKACEKPSASTYCGLLRQTDQPSGNCNEQFPLFKNLSRIYECPRDGNSHYIPRNDTYPNNCNKYIWCVNGGTYLYTSPNQTHFVYTNNSSDTPFDFSDTSSTYCAQRRKYTECLNRNGVPDVGL